jgi:hypothetical protein
MSGEAASIPEENDSDLNWSVSGISTASGFDPDQYTARGSNIPTPELTHEGQDEIDKLINSVKDLKTSLATISEKTVTPTNSPRSVETNQPRTVIKNTTPPVKDPGPDVSSLKLDQMRQMLRQLEASRKHTRRSLSFQSDDKSTHIADQFKEMNEFLDRCKASKNELLEQEQQKNAALAQEQQALRQQLKAQNAEIVRLQKDLSSKDGLLLELKSCWAQAVQALNKEREEILEEKARSEENFARLKSEQNEAKSQFYVCQNELEKALLLASEFKQKLDADDELKTELSAKMAEERQNFETRLRLLADERDSAKEDMAQMSRKWQEAVQDKENYEKIMARERQGMERERETLRLGYEDRLKNELSSKLKANEESLHAFYLTQMESILSEKIGTLQDYINEWEKKLFEEKQEALSQLQGKHTQQIQAFKRQFHQLEAQIKASEAIHIASKREAAALRGQLEMPAVTRSCSPSSSEEDSLALASRRSLPTHHSSPAKLNNRKARRSAASSSRMSSVTTVMNNLKKRSSLEQELRPHSAGAKLVGL